MQAVEVLIPATSTTLTCARRWTYDRRVARLTYGDAVAFR